MSLLMKALQNAARNREAAGTARGDPPESESDSQLAASGELSLEPVQPSARATRAQAASGERAAAPEQRPPSGAQQQAQTIMRAGTRPARPAPKQPGIFDWLARRPLVAFSTAAGLFAIGYFHQRQDLFTSKKDKSAAAELQGATT